MDEKEILYMIENNIAIDWYSISVQRKLSEEFIREFKDNVVWYKILMYQKLSEEFIREFEDKIKWYPISRYQKLSEEFIREFEDKIDWYRVSRYQKLSEEFIREFEDKINWYEISMYQKLSEEFIREFKDKVNWQLISIYQKLSEEFIREFEDYVVWSEISSYQKLSKKIIKEFGLNINEDNWLYKPIKLKKEIIVNTHLFECHDEYFIAFKGIRDDDYSNYNFQYHYLYGNIYESHADHTINENSFGLSAWTYKKAKEHCDEKIIKVKIHYKNVARYLPNTSKIRCNAFEVIK